MRIPTTYLRIALVSGGNLINAALGFCFVIGVARLLSLEELGQYALYTSILLLFAKLLDFGTNPLFVSNNDISSHKLQELLSTKLLLLTIGVLGGFVVLKVAGLLSFSIFLIYLVGLCSYTFFYLAFAHLHINQNFVGLFFIQFIPAVIKGLIGIHIIMGVYHPPLMQIIYAFSISVLPSVFFLPVGLFTKFKVNLGKSLKDIKIAFPAGVSQIISEGWPSITNYFAKNSGGFSNVGIYSIAERFSDVFALISSAVFTVLLTQNSKRYKETKEYNIKESVILCIGFFAVAACTTLVSEPVLTFLFGNKFSEAVSIFNIMVFASAGFGVSSFLENYFFVHNRSRHILQISLVRLFTFLISALVLVPIYNLFGLALASLISALLATLTTVWLIKKHHTNS